MTTLSIFVSRIQKELAEERRAVKAFIEGDFPFTVFLFGYLQAAEPLEDAVKGARNGTKGT